jgi:hypothetical protein
MVISFFSSDKPRWWGLVQHRIDRGFARSIQAVMRSGGAAEVTKILACALRQP